MSFYSSHYIHAALVCLLVLEVIAFCSSSSLSLLNSAGVADANVVVFIASGTVAGTLILVILIVSIILIVICLKNVSQQHDQVDLPEWHNDTWMGQKKRISIVKDGSSVSSDSNELPTSSTGGVYTSRAMAQHSTSGAAKPDAFEGSIV